MHGQLKVKASLREEERKKKERYEKVEKYKLLMAKFFDKKKDCELDNEVFSVISDLLSNNPDVYSLWNYRRKILLHSLEIEEKGVLSKLLKDELKFTETCLRLNPKSYCCWHHREWCLNNFPQPDLAKELELCTLYLKLDQRNFHCWDYRRMVAAKLSVPPEKELDYTMVKINENFSNYSSWHYRSKLLPKVHPSAVGACTRQHMILQEVELVVSAAFTDPGDQSAWFYQRWLVAGTKKDPSLVAALHLEDNVYLAFSQPTPACVISVSTPYNSLSSLSPHLMVVEGVKEGVLSLQLASSQHTLELGVSSPSGQVLFLPRPVPLPLAVTPTLASLLTDQLSTCHQLLALEPDSKWGLLTSAHMMWLLDREKYSEEVLCRLESLVKVDPLRAEYYRDLSSRWTMEVVMSHWEDTLGQQVSLRGRHLYSLPLSQYLLVTKKLDLSDNCLSGRSLAALLPLQACQELILDKNKVESLSEMPAMASLERLSVKGNLLSEWSEVAGCLSRQPRVQSVHLGNNPLPKSHPPFQTSVQLHLEA